MRDLLRNFFSRGQEYEEVEPVDIENAIRKSVVVDGRVQGVGFRFFTQQQALKLRITGWVKNQSDGSVAMEIQGAPEDIDELISRLKKGTGYSKVVKLQSKDLEVEKDERRFIITY